MSELADQIARYRAAHARLTRPTGVVDSGIVLRPPEPPISPRDEVPGGVPRPKRRKPAKPTPGTKCPGARPPPLVIEVMIGRNRHPTFRDVQSAVAFVCRVSRGDLIAIRRRPPELVRARHIAIALVCYLCRWSTPRTGHAFGNRDHSTIVHALRRFADIAATDEGRAIIDAALARLAGQGFTIPEDLIP